MFYSIILYRVIFTFFHLLENKIEPNCDIIGVKMNIILNMLSRKEYLMSYENAMQWLKDLNLNNEPIDFTKYTDEQILKTSITVDLISIEEYNAFESELVKRNLVEKYYSMRNMKST